MGNDPDELPGPEDGSREPVGPIPRCHLFVTADCYGDCSVCPFGALQTRPPGKPGPDIKGAGRLIERARPIAYAVVLIIILALLVWHAFIEYR